MCVTCGCGEGETTVRLVGETMRLTNMTIAMRTRMRTARRTLMVTSIRTSTTRRTTTATTCKCPDAALETAILGKNQALAERNRGWLAGRGVLALNLMSSPVAGKTTLLERGIRELQCVFQRSWTPVSV